MSLARGLTKQTKTIIMNHKFRAWYLPDGNTPDGMIKFISKIVDDELVFVAEDEETIKYPFYIPFLDEDWIVEYPTGMLDENGIEIFEGDVIRVEFDANILFLADGRELIGLCGGMGEIKRRSKLVKVERSELGFNHFYTVNEIGSFGRETLSVMGNIHQDKNLLKSTDL